jgi:release factor glutamine methyltransferase
LVADLGTGSGAIALALASERPTWQLYATDRSAQALAVARENGERCLPGRVHFLESDWYGALAGLRFHLLASNPPYIEPGDLHLEEGDLRFEPQGALVAAQRGMADLATLAAGSGEHLEPGGWLLLEHGYEQGAAVRSLLQGKGFSRVETRRDLAGQERITGGCLGAD